MKSIFLKIYQILGALGILFLFLIFSFQGCSGEFSPKSSSQPGHVGFIPESYSNYGKSSHDGNNHLQSWNPPSGTFANNTFSVQVRSLGSSNWEQLFIYNIKTGHQDGVQTNSSAAIFDFEGTLEVLLTYNAGALNSFDIRPNSYGVSAVKHSNTLYFQITQNLAAARKIVVRINDSWESEVIHLLTNPLEMDAPSLGDPSVFAVKPGTPAPLNLPEGKSTYYFEPGSHELPRGSWLEADLGGSHLIDRFNLSFSDLYDGASLEKQRFVLEARLTESDPYHTIYDCTQDECTNIYCTVNNCSTTSINTYFLETPQQVRFVRLKLLGNDVTTKFQLGNSLNELMIFAQGGQVNLAAGRGISGAMPNFSNAFDGDLNTRFGTPEGSLHSKEAFYLNRPGTSIYLAPGSVVHGAIVSSNISNTKIYGRGLIDGSLLTQNPGTLQEAGAGAIWQLYGSNNSVEGISIFNSPAWAVVMNNSQNAIVRQVNIMNNVIIGDGIHFDGATGGLIDSVFIRSCDDQVTMYHYGPTHGNLVRNSVFWGDDARTIVIGLGERPGDIYSNRFQNIDILNQQAVVAHPELTTGALYIVASGDNEIRDLVFSDIRIDPVRFASRHASFVIETSYADPELASPGKGVRNISFQNLTTRNSSTAKSEVSTYDASRPVVDIDFNSMVIGDTVVKEFSSWLTTSLEGVSNINFSDRYPGDQPSCDRNCDTVYFLGPENTLWVRWLDHHSGNWHSQSLLIEANSNPVTSSNNGNKTWFAGPNGNLWVMSRNGSDFAAHDSGIPIKGNPSVSGDGNIVNVRGLNNKLWVIWNSNGSWQFNDSGLSIYGNPTQSADGMIVHFKGPDNTLWTRWSSNGIWHASGSGIQMTGDPVTSANGLVVNFLGKNNKLWVRWLKDNKWNVASSNTVMSGSAATSVDANIVAFRGLGNDLWMRWNEGGSWQSSNSGIEILGNPSVSWNSHIVNFRGADNTLWVRWLTSEWNVSGSGLMMNQSRPTYSF